MWRLRGVYVPRAVIMGLGSHSKLYSGGTSRTALSINKSAAAAASAVDTRARPPPIYRGIYTNTISYKYVISYIRVKYFITHI